ncbi:inorganic diphosphatase [Stieleria sp. JC731]|uniref:inorganic diphosphatase n=1 Tax=Pirellulaceae TaxID=2691357 RepID=UPI001E460CE7|nr:inorganic diphosphatase [Stieleria sp. JC731]MCC9601256.1 inorganic diphosphatase [Stieleria sp. JC731]
MTLRSTTIVHPWHGVSPGDEAPEIVNVIVEIPLGGNIKYELDKASGLLKVDRVLFSAVHYPANYGFIPGTFADDDDPLDVMVLCQEPVVPLALMQVRPIGLMTMIDEGRRDHKVIAVATKDAEYCDFRELDDLPHHRLDMVRRFFMDYKTLENKDVEVEGFSPASVAHQVINESIQGYRDKFLNK